jgi:hypothetical protein
MPRKNKLSMTTDIFSKSGESSHVVRKKGGSHPLTSSIPLIERDKHRTGSWLVQQKGA